MSGSVCNGNTGFECYSCEPETICLESISGGVGEDKNERQGKQIVHDLHEREALGAVILEDDGFMLFHAKSSGVLHPVMMVFRPEAGVFTHLDASNIHVVVILLIPPEVHPELHHLMSVLSSSLLEDEVYKAAVFGEDKHRLKQEVKRRVSEPFNAWILSQVTP